MVSVGSVSFQYERPSGSMSAVLAVFSDILMSSRRVDGVKHFF